MDWDSMDTSISTSHVMEEAWEDEGGAGVIMEALL